MPNGWDEKKTTIQCVENGPYMVKGPVVLKGDKGEPIGVVDVNRPVDHPVQVRSPEEAECNRVLRQSVEERTDRLAVISADRANVCGRAVAQCDVRFALARIPAHGADSAESGS